MAFKMKGFSAFGKDEKKKIKIDHDKSTEYVTGGRKGDKKHKSIVYRNQDNNNKITKTTRQKGKDRKDKAISKTRSKIEQGIRNIFHKNV